MKNQQKKPAFLLLLAVIFMGCTIFFAMVGICGKIDFLQESALICTTLGVPAVCPRGFIFGWLSGMLMVLCGYGAYRRKAQKKRYGMLILGLFLAFWLNVLCYARSVFFLYATLVVAGLFAWANIPPAVAIAITKQLITQNATGSNTASSSRQQLCRMEWVRFFPVKRFLVGCMWLSCLAFAIIGMMASYQKPELDSLAVILLFFGVAAWTARSAWRYVATPYHCVPVFNKIFTRREIEQLLMGETFTEFPLEDERLQKHMPILVSENWMFVEGTLVSRKLLLGGTVLRRTLTSGGVYRRSSRLVFYYLDGSTVQTPKTNFYLTNENMPAIKKALGQLAGISIPSACKQTLIAEKYRTILPELQDSKEKLRYLLIHDVSDIKQEFASALAPNHQPHKKKRSQKVAERKA